MEQNMIWQKIKTRLYSGKSNWSEFIYKNKKEYIPVRICAVAKSDDDIKKSQRQMKK